MTEEELKKIHTIESLTYLKYRYSKSGKHFFWVGHGKEIFLRSISLKQAVEKLTSKKSLVMFITDEVDKEIEEIYRGNHA